MGGRRGGRGGGLGAVGGGRGRICMEESCMGGPHEFWWMVRMTRGAFFSKMGRVSHPDYNIAGTVKPICVTPPRFRS